MGNTVDSGEVALQVATADDAPILSNLLQLYIHDMSEIVSVQLGSDGRFGYPRLPLYWSDPERRFAFLVRWGERLAGFALVTRGSPAADDPDTLDVAEFFVLRQYRRSGMGRQAAYLLWNRFTGRWTVRVWESNRSGVPFWKSVVTAYTKGAFEERTYPDNPHPRRVFTFSSVAT